MTISTGLTSRPTYDAAAALIRDKQIEAERELAYARIRAQRAAQRSAQKAAAGQSLFNALKQRASQGSAQRAAAANNNANLAQRQREVEANRIERANEANRRADAELRHGADRRVADMRRQFTALTQRHAGIIEANAKNGIGFSENDLKALKELKEAQEKIWRNDGNLNSQEDMWTALLKNASDMIRFHPSERIETPTDQFNKTAVKDENGNTIGHLRPNGTIDTSLIDQQEDNKRQQEKLDLDIQTRAMTAFDTLTKQGYPADVVRKSIMDNPVYKGFDPLGGVRLPEGFTPQTPATPSDRMKIMNQLIKESRDSNKPLDMNTLGQKVDERWNAIQGNRGSQPVKPPPAPLGWNGFPESRRHSGSLMAPGGLPPEPSNGPGAPLPPPRPMPSQFAPVGGIAPPVPSKMQSMGPFQIQAITRSAMTQEQFEASQMARAQIFQGLDRTAAYKSYLDMRNQVRMSIPEYPTNEADFAKYPPDQIFRSMGEDGRPEFGRRQPIPTIKSGEPQGSRGSSGVDSIAGPNSVSQGAAGGTGTYADDLRERMFKEQAAKNASVAPPEPYPGVSAKIADSMEFNIYLKSLADKKAEMTPSQRAKDALSDTPTISPSMQGFRDWQGSFRDTLLSSARSKFETAKRDFLESPTGRAWSNKNLPGTNTAKPPVSRMPETQSQSLNGPETDAEWLDRIAPNKTPSASKGSSAKTERIMQDMLGDSTKFPDYSGVPGVDGSEAAAKKEKISQRMEELSQMRGDFERTAAGAEKATIRLNQRIAKLGNILKTPNLTIQERQKALEEGQRLLQQIDGAKGLIADNISRINAADKEMRELNGGLATETELKGMQREATRIEKQVADMKELAKELRQGQPESVRRSEDLLKNRIPQLTERLNKTRESIEQATAEVLFGPVEKGSKPPVVIVTDDSKESRAAQRELGGTGKYDPSDRSPGWTTRGPQSDGNRPVTKELLDSLDREERKKLAEELFPPSYDSGPSFKGKLSDDEFQRATDDERDADEKIRESRRESWLKSPAGQKWQKDSDDLLKGYNSILKGTPPPSEIMKSSTQPWRSEAIPSNDGKAGSGTNLPFDARIIPRDKAPKFLRDKADEKGYPLSVFQGDDGQLQMTSGWPGLNKFIEKLSLKLPETSRGIGPQKSDQPASQERGLDRPFTEQPPREGGSGQPSDLRTQRDLLRNPGFTEHAIREPSQNFDQWMKGNFSPAGNRGTPADHKDYLKSRDLIRRQLPYVPELTEQNIKRSVPDGSEFIGPKGNVLKNDGGIARPLSPDDKLSKEYQPKVPLQEPDFDLHGQKMKFPAPAMQPPARPTMPYQTPVQPPPAPYQQDRLPLPIQQPRRSITPPPMSAPGRLAPPPASPPIPKMGRPNAKSGLSMNSGSTTDGMAALNKQLSASAYQDFQQRKAAGLTGSQVFVDPYGGFNPLQNQDDRQQQFAIPQPQWDMSTQWAGGMQSGSIYGIGPGNQFDPYNPPYDGGFGGGLYGPGDYGGGNSGPGDYGGGLQDYYQGPQLPAYEWQGPINIDYGGGEYQLAGGGDYGGYGDYGSLG